MTWHRPVLIAGIAMAARLFLPAPAAASGGGLLSADRIDVLFYLLTWLFPLGIALVAVGLSDPSRAAQVATSLPLALALSLAAYYLCGFALHFGGIGLVSNEPGLAGFISEWSPLDLRLGPGWGLLGLRGFMPLSAEMPPQALDLFVAELPWVTTVTLIPLITLSGRMPRLPVLFLTLWVSCVCYPLVGNWIRGGGWLSHVGTTLGLGQGFVDYGFSALHWVGGCAALAGLLAFRRRGLEAPREPAQLPHAYLPLNILAGAFLAFVGWLAMALSQSFVSLPGPVGEMILAVLFAVAGAVLATLFYGWLARGELDPGLTGRGIVGSLVVVGAGAPFISPWVAALSGALYGLLLAPAMYLVERVFRLDDRGAVVSVHGFAALWGLLTVALFADGRAGTQVVGYLAGGAARDAGQLYAQLLGLGAIGILAALVPWTLLTLIAQAYALPPRVREAARLRAAQAQERNWARERERRQGRSLGARQQAWATYLRITARSLRRLSRRKRQYPSRPPHIRSA